MQTMIISFVILIVLVVIGYGLYYHFTMRGVKQPKYQIIYHQDKIEVRQYQPILLANVVTSGDRKTAISNGFWLLADYIFGNNYSEQGGTEKIPMTAPVVQQQKIAMTAPVMQNELAKNQWQVSFVMPEKYTIESIPKPHNTKVKLQTIPAQKVVVIRFNGNMTDKNLQYHLQQLDSFVRQQQMKVTNPPQYAFYNPPWTLPFMRRNEIMYRIIDDDKK